MSGCRIGKVTFKNGTTLHVFPFERRNLTHIDLGWGEVRLRCYDDKRMTLSDIHYMLDAAKKTNMEVGND